MLEKQDPMVKKCLYTTLCYKYFSDINLLLKMFRLLSNIRLFHIQSCMNFCSSSASVVDKKLLGELRKKTGFTFVNCKKALQQFNNDIKQAEEWLREQAQKEGWQKASKLQGRPMSQGLVAVMTEGNKATMIEINCETDFVARNQKFHELVQKLAASCQQYFNDCSETKVLLKKEEVNKISVESQVTLGDLVAQEVGNIGENMSLRRAAFLQTSFPGGVIGSYIHSMQGSGKVGECTVGKFAALVSVLPDGADINQQTMIEIGQRLSQHVVGMNPLKIGDPENDTPASNKDNEKCLIFQEFLMDESKTAGQYIAESSVTVADFVRFECGEELSEEMVEQAPVAAVGA